MRAGAFISPELFLDVALTSWLPALRESPEAAAALEDLARKLIAEHHDFTLSEILGGSGAKNFSSASALLAKAIAEDASGDRKQAFSDATSAAEAFLRDGNTAGTLRAREEALYALSRDTRTEECLEASARLLPRLSENRYPWARVQTLLARATCLERLGDLGSATGLKSQARRITEESRLDILRLRVLGLQASASDMIGNRDAARRQNHQGLTSFWKGNYPPLRAYQFYSDMVNVAERENHVQAAYLMSQEAVPMIALAGNRSAEVLARYHLATLAGLTGHADRSADEIRRADALTQGEKGALENRAARAERLIQMARSYLRQGQPVLAGKTLARVQEQDVKGSVPLQLALHTSTGEAALRQGRTQDAYQQLVKARAVAETALETVQSQRDRATWLSRVEPSYRQLVRLTLEAQPQDALAIWEKFRGSPVDATPHSGAETELLHDFAMSLRTATVVTFIQFEDQVAGWLYDDRGTFPFHSSLSWSRAEKLCGDFQKLTSNPSSDVQRIRETGRQIYEALLGPVEQRFASGRVLTLEPDGPCASIAFEALTDTKGQYLADRFALMTSPGAFVARSFLPNRYSVQPGLRALIVGDPRIAGEMAAHYPELPDAYREAQMVATVFPGAKVLTRKDATLSAVKQALPQAQLLHFAGHGLSTTDSGTLLLAAPGSSAGAAMLDSNDMESLLGATHLAVLSACYTGVGEFDPDSLIQSLWRAGVPNVVATRWAVDSSAAFQIMSGFYKSLAKGTAPSAALRAATTTLRQNPAFSHPAKWGAFHVFGSPILKSQEP